MKGVVCLYACAPGLYAKGEKRELYEGCARDCTRGVRELYSSGLRRPCTRCVGRALEAGRVSCEGRVGVSTAHARARVCPDGGTERESIHEGT
jgi:hypothetical protein